MGVVASSCGPPDGRPGPNARGDSHGQRSVAGTFLATPDVATVISNRAFPRRCSTARSYRRLFHSQLVQALIPWTLVAASPHAGHVHVVCMRCIRGPSVPRSSTRRYTTRASAKYPPVTPQHGPTDGNHHRVTPGLPDEFAAPGARGHAATLALVGEQRHARRLGGSPLPATVAVPPRRGRSPSMSRPRYLSLDTNAYVRMSRTG